MRTEILITLGYLFSHLCSTFAIGLLKVTESNYAVLIKDVHIFYKTSCVFLIHPGTNDDLNVTRLMYSWSLDFSHRGIFSLALPFSELPNKTGEYHKRIARPLFVILLNTVKSKEEFANATKHLDISFPVWFVIFMNYPNRPLEEFCRRPKQNDFNLAFSTEMLVLCYDYPILKEWYAISDNRTRIFSLATWSPERGLMLTTENSLYARRSNMYGETLRITTVKESPTSGVKHGKLSGYFGEMVIELSKVMNFKIELTSAADAYGNWDNNEKVWTGAVGQLVANKADFGVAEFGMTSPRMDVIDFTLPLFCLEGKIYIKKPDGASVAWSAYLKAFDSDIWSVIVIIIITTPIGLTLIKTKGRFSIKILIEYYTHVWGVYCQQGLAEFPNESPLRLAFFSIFISAIIVSSAYSASLISFLTTTTTTLPFTTMEGFADDGTYEFIVFKHTADYDLFMNTQDKVLLKVQAIMKEDEELPDSRIAGFHQVCNERVGLYGNEALKNAYAQNLKCQLAWVNTGKLTSMAMILTKGNPYTGLINYHLQKFYDHGIQDRLKEIYWITSRSSESSNHSIVTLWGVAPILAVLAGGILVGWIFLLIERTHYFMKTNDEGTWLLLQKIFGLLNTSVASESRNRVAEKTLKSRERFQLECNKKAQLEYWP